MGYDEHEANGNGNGRNRKTWKEKAAEWAFQQGTSTVLLLLILFLNATFGIFLMKEVLPGIVKAQLESQERQIDQIQKGYDRQELQHAAQIKYLADAFKEMRGK